MHTFDDINAASLRSDVPDFRAGDTLKVHVKVIEGTRSRVQVFQGVVIRRHGGGIGETFTVRKISFGVGVERTFPVHTPVIEKIELVTRGDVRRAKLYYLRDRVGKRARVRERRYIGPEEIVEGGLLYGDEGGATDASGMTADEVVSTEGGADLAAETPQTDAPNLEAEGVAETPAEEAALQPDQPEGDAPVAADEPVADEPASDNAGAEPKAEGEGSPAPDAESAGGADPADAAEADTSQA